MEIDVLKIIVLISIFLVTLFVTFIPIIIQKKINNVRNDERRHSFEKIISLLSCFGGGVFLATCFLHLFPEVKEQLENALEKNGVQTSFPAAEFLTIFGCLTVLSLEQIVLKWKESSPHNGYSILEQSHGSSYGSISPEPESPTHHRRRGSYDSEGDDLSVHEDPSSHSSLRSLFLVFSLSVHSIFEGIAIGLQPTIEKVLQLVGAVIIHKCVIAFTLSLNLLHSKLNSRTVIQCNIIFSLMASSGIGIAIAIDDYSNGSGILLTNGVLQGLACGTFLYVTFFEVLPHEMNNEKNRLEKLLCLILGCVLVTVLLLVFPDS